LPACADGPLPAIVEFDGYGRGRGEPIENLLWASAGFAHLEMDTRGQSWSGWRSSTPDPHGSEAHGPGLSSGFEGFRCRPYYGTFVPLSEDE
jgi:cephalosporin-C deacetylase